MAKGDHTQQKEFLFPLVTRDPLILRKSHQEYMWKPTTLVDSMLLFQRDLWLKQLNPEINGKVELLSHYEDRVGSLLSWKPDLVLNEVDYHARLDFGVQLLARFDATRALYTKGCHVNSFNDNFRLIKEIANPLYQRGTITGVIELPRDLMVVGDTPIVFDPKMMFYPVSSRAIFYAYTGHVGYSLFREIKDDHRMWPSLMLERTQEWVLAHPKSDPELLTAIEICYTYGEYAFRVP